MRSYARTEQDNDISLYSLPELQAMFKRYQGNSTTWQPFTFKEVNAEIRRRTGKPTFLQEWTREQFKAIEKAIATYFRGKELHTNKGEYIKASRTFKMLGEIIGFAYTSSSSYAGYWVCNVELKYNPQPEFKYIGFAIGEDGKFYAVLWDKYKNEIIIEL